MSIYVNMSFSGLGWKKSCVSIIYESIKKEILKLLRLTSSGSTFKTTTVLISVTMKTTELARALHAYSFYPFKTIQQSDRLMTKRKKRGRKKTLEGDCCVGYYHVLSTCLGKVDEYLTEGGVNRFEDRRTDMGERNYSDIGFWGHILRSGGFWSLSGSWISSIFQRGLWSLFVLKCGSRNL